MKKLPWFMAILCACLLAPSAFAKMKEKITKFTFEFAGKSRIAYSVIPEKEGPLPVIILLHGSGRDGEIMASLWKGLARREGFIVAAPDAYDSAFWDSTNDAPEFFRDLVVQIKAQHAIDESRIYLFGHSAGASYALFLAVIDSDIFAATAVHAGCLQANPNGLFDQAERKMPIAIWVGDHDLFFPVDVVRATKRLFDSNGYNVELSVILSHDHNYYAISDEINQKAWNFLKKTQLPPASPGSRP